MNAWTQLSIEYANQRSYLDDLFHFYPTIPDGIREVNGGLWQEVLTAFEARDNTTLLRTLMALGAGLVLDKIRRRFPWLQLI